ncbi:histidine kinase/DNA gyrase B/HSP90-like ATPase [Shewanella fodinae]|uniref:histidine kinase n=2 Tax=Shewanella fodinae TaxID=552357 RepID=A0A4R2FHQ1_9GAMM|nr:histidine kinase/DNA gyrase B/HSP90-like ATPase [Shewanella fodinae]
MRPPITEQLLRQTGNSLADLTEDSQSQFAATSGVAATKDMYLEMRKLIHDLKLPLTLVNGELEAIEDGVRAWTPETTRTLLSEIEQLKSMLTAMMPCEHVAPNESTATEISCLLMTHLHVLSEQTTLSITHSVCPDISINIQPWAFKRILDNLSSNTVKYTYHPGCLHVSLTRQQQKVLLLWQDSAPAPTAEELYLLGKQGYRAELTDHEMTQGSGTGLANVTALVSQANGEISFQHNGFGGLTVAIKFPLTSLYGG